MTLPELAAAITPIAEQFAHELALEQAQFQADHGTCPACRPAQDAASILCAFIHALDAAANQGQPEQLRALTLRVGFAPAVRELVTR